MNDTPASRLEANIEQACATLRSLGPLADAVTAAADDLGDCLVAGGKLLTCGNGGSAADAAHMSTEFVCRFMTDRRPFPAICLNAHGGDLTAIGNDYAFTQVFQRQVYAFGKPGDVLLAITTTGNSENIRLAIAAANDIGMTSIALLGRDGGACRGLATVELLVPGDVTARIQEAQKLLIHTICESVEPRLADAT